MKDPREPDELYDPAHRRGGVLLVLLDAYPRGLRRPTVEKAMFASYQGEDKLFNRDLVWLQNQKLIVRTTEEIPGRGDVEVWTITDDGVLIVEGTAERTGVKIAKPVQKPG